MQKMRPVPICFLLVAFSRTLPSIAATKPPAQSYGTCEISATDLQNLKQLTACRLTQKTSNCRGLGFGPYSTDNQVQTKKPGGLFSQARATLAEHEKQMLRRHDRRDRRKG